MNAISSARPTLSFLFAALLVGAPAVAFAQDAKGEEEPAQVPDGLEEPGLQEKTKRTEKVEQVDPDPALNAKVEGRYKELRELLNKFQEEIGHKSGELTAKDAKDWDKLAAAADKLVQTFIGDYDVYVEKHRPLLESFQASTNAGKPVEAGQTAKEIIKLRTGFLGQLEKLAKGADKVNADWTKLEERIKKNAGK